jgi:hypothetical protein
MTTVPTLVIVGAGRLVGRELPPAVLVSSSS